MSERAKTRHKQVVRIFFNTYYEDEAEKAIKLLSELGEIRVERSSIVPELYFVELRGGKGADLEEIRDRALEALSKLQTLFGVKAYIVVT